MHHRPAIEALGSHRPRHPAARGTRLHLAPNGSHGLQGLRPWMLRAAPLSRRPCCHLPSSVSDKVLAAGTRLVNISPRSRTLTARRMVVGFHHRSHPSCSNRRHCSIAPRIRFHHRKPVCLTMRSTPDPKVPSSHRHCSNSINLLRQSRRHFGAGQLVR